MANPIPVKHRDEFIRWMRSEMEATPGTPSEWDMLNAAEEYLIKKKFQRGNPQDAVNYYLRFRNINPQQGESV